MIIDLSLKNNQLYAGCDIETIAGRLNLTTPVADAIELVRKNIQNMDVDPDEVELTGPMAVWSYLTVFDSVVQHTTSVYYNDGRNPRVLITTPDD